MANSKLTALLDHWRGHRHIWLLVSLLFMSAIHPLSRELQFSVRLLDVWLTIVLLAAVFAACDRRWHVWGGIILLVLTLVSMWSLFGYEALVGKPSTVMVAFSFSWLVVLLTTAVMSILGHVMRAKKIDMDEIAGAISVYLLFGVLCALLYSLINYVDPDSFQMAVVDPPENARSGFERYGDFQYFSFVTMSTLGYGDIGPVSPIARSLAWIQAVTGQLYIAILIARLVGLNIADAQRRER
jgi:hypothetical protein